MDYETIRTSTHAAVVARPFTRVAGQPTFEQKEKFLAEAEALAIDFTVSYPWADEHGLLAEVMGAAKYLSKTGETYVAPVHPSIADPRILLGGLSQVAIRVAQAVNDTAKIDFAVVEGFRSGFGVIFRQAFDLTYYEQLWEKTFIYKCVLPITYITHLETRHVILDTVVVKRSRENYYLPRMGCGGTHQLLRRATKPRVTQDPPVPAAHCHLRLRQNPALSGTDVDADGHL